MFQSESTSRKFDFLTPNINWQWPFFLEYLEFWILSLEFPDSLQQILHLTKRAGVKNYKTESQLIFFCIFNLLRFLTFYSLLVTKFSSTFSIHELYFPLTQCIYGFCTYLRANSDFCPLYHKLISFYDRDERCLLRGTNWVFLSLLVNCKGLIKSVYIVRAITNS